MFVVFLGLPVGLGGGASRLTFVFLGVPLSLEGSPSVVVVVGVFLGLTLGLGIALQVPTLLLDPAATKSYNIKWITSQISQIYIP